MPAPTPRRRAFIAAITAYPVRLPGPAWDIGLFARILKEKYHFEDADIRRIEDAEVTAHALDDGLSWLIQDFQPGDRGVFYFSGHGVRVEKDGKFVEALVCVDESEYFDTHFVKTLAGAPKGTVTAIIDSCHSAGLDRDDIRVFGLSSKRARPAAPELDRDGSPWRDAGVLGDRGGALVSASDELDRGGALVSASDELDRGGLLIGDDEDGDRGDAPCRDLDDFYRDGESSLGVPPSAPVVADELPPLNAILLAACRYYETSSIGMRSTDGYSPLTWSLRDMIEESGAGISNQELFKGIQEMIRGLGLEQVPVLYLPDGEPESSPLGRASFILLEPGAAAPNPPVFWEGDGG